MATNLPVRRGYQPRGIAAAAVALTLVAVSACVDLMVDADPENGGPDPPLAEDVPLMDAPLVVGWLHACQQRQEGLYCWGGMQGGSFPPAYGAEPTRLNGGAVLAGMAAGPSFSCGVASDGRVYCWGQAGRELGSGDHDDVRVHEPTPIHSDRRFSVVTADIGGACALEPTGEAWCWGSRLLGAGYDEDGEPITMSSVPVPVVGGKRFVAIHRDYHKVCAVDGRGHVYCWGYSPGAGEHHYEPRLFSDRVEVTALAGAFYWAEVTPGQWIGCGLDAHGTAHCWDHEALGPEAFELPGGLRFRQLVGGYTHMCGLTRDEGVAYCWGHTALVGDGTGPGSWRREPAAVSGDLRFDHIAAGNQSTCGRTVEGETWCWGYNRGYQLGIADMEYYTATPVRVDFP